MRQLLMVKSAKMTWISLELIPINYSQNLGIIENVRELLIDHNVNGVNNQGDTPLIIAVRNGSYIRIGKHMKDINLSS